MKCRECGGSMTVEHDAVRRYDIGGLHNVVLHGVQVARCESCAEEDITIPRIGQLHRALADFYVRQPRLFAGDEIRFLRKHMGLSTSDFAQRMGVTRETVSRWENGTAMGTSADRLLRVLVATHEPSDSYEIDDLLKELLGSLPTDLTAQKPAPVDMENSPTAGWTHELAAA